MSRAPDRGAGQGGRPSLTPAFTCGLALWSACAASYSHGKALSAGACQAAGTVALLLAVGAIVAIIALRPRAAWFLAAFALLGIGLGAGAAAQCHLASDEFAAGRHGGVTVVLCGDTRKSASGESAFARIESGGTPAVVRVVFASGEPRLCGEAYQVDGSFKRADWEQDDYLWQNNAIGTLSVAGDATALGDASPYAPLRALRKEAIRAIGSDDDAHALMQALACGYRHDIAQTALYSSFQRAGLAHLVAVSGAHLVILTGLIAACLQALRAPRRLTVGLLIASMLAYLAVSGMPLSAVRAAIMSSVGVLALIGKRRPSAQNALGIGVMLVVCLHPSDAVSASFALSALSTAGIVLFAPLLAQWLSSVPVCRMPAVRDSLALTLSANLLSQLYACSLFNQLPLIGPFANVVCAPLFPVSCGAALAAALCGAAAVPGASLVLAAASAAARVLGDAVSAVSALPYASVPVSIGTEPAIALTALIAAVLWLAWPSPDIRKALAATVPVALALIAYAYTLGAEDCIVMLDVGQGDAFLVKSRGAAMLIDTGNRDSQLVEQLARSGTFKLDAVLVTHLDDDHCGSLDALERAVHVDRVIMMADTLSSTSEKGTAVVAQARRTAGEVVAVRAGDEFEIGTFTAHVVWPERFQDDGGNADSVCVLLSHDADGDGRADAKALFTGDAEREQLAELLKSGAVGQVDILKVGHHGSKNAMDESEVRALSPKVGLIGVGAGNRYGHPSQEALDLLESVGCRVYRSDLDGQVKCAFGSESIRVSLQ